MGLALDSGQVNDRDFEARQLLTRCSEQVLAMSAVSYRQGQRRAEKVDQSSISSRVETFQPRSLTRSGTRHNPPLSPSLSNPIFPRGADENYSIASGGDPKSVELISEQNEARMIGNRSQNRQPPRSSSSTELAPSDIRLVREVQLRDFRRFALFLNDHPEILQERGATQRYQAAAVKALQSGNDGLAKNYVEKGVIVAACSDLSFKQMTTYFSRLVQGDQEALNQLNSAFSKSLQSCSQQADDSSILHKPKSSTTARGRKERDSGQMSGMMSDLYIGQNGNGGRTSTDIPRRKDARRRNSSDDDVDLSGRSSRRSTRQDQLQSLHTSRYDSLVSPVCDELVNDEENAPANRHLTGTSVFVPSIRGARTDREHMDPRFRRREPKLASRFFKIGRVFAVLWHIEDTGSGKTEISTWKTATGHGQVLYSHIRRLVVVKEGHGFCWAIPINTYGNQGISKRGFTDDDRKAHAIIHLENQQPTRVGGEPEMVKRPISVIPATSEVSLDKASRINFAKVHTVEHNVKAMDIGMVGEDSKSFFTAYWRMHVL